MAARMAKIFSRVCWVTIALMGFCGRAVRGGTEDLTLAGSRWIWMNEGNPAVDAPIDTRYFRKTFELPPGQAIRRATMLATADNAYIAWINGKQVAATEQLRDVPPMDVTSALHSGKNIIAVQARNIFSANAVGKNPAGLIVKIEIELVDGKALTIPTDATWKSSRKADEDWRENAFDDSTWTAVKDLGAPGDAPWGPIGPVAPEVIPENFPRFIVPGHEREMELLRRLFWHHYQVAGPAIPLWDEWMSMSTLWEAFDDTMPGRWDKALSSRRIDAEGYVACQQHDGTGHSGGWPFPLWHQGAGIGWHYAPIGVSGYEPPLATTAGWKFSGIQAGAVGNGGWALELTDAHATAQPPAFAVDVFQAPFIRINWRASGMGDAKPFVEWTTRQQPEFSADRRVYFEPVDSMTSESRTMLAMYKHPKWTGVVTGIRVNFGNAPGAKVILKSLHTAYDTRQNINNSNFIIGCCNDFAWTGDGDLLRRNIEHMRKAMNFAMTEFDTRRSKCIHTTWVGHDGRTGVSRDGSGKKQLLVGHGIGSDYWDILPFGADDCIATIYYYHAVRCLADLEEQIAGHPAWNISREGAFDPADLRAHAAEVKAFAGQKFWIEKTGRFGSGADADGVNHDYGFTFVNNEAIYYDFATKEQAASIESWLTGKRIVDGDTSQRDDIYRWRFGPRATTRRNLDWYFWGWSSPESLAFGDQVQDGGAVLGFSYFDMMARIKTLGPDFAEPRLAEICNWFADTQSSGGYRAYYSVPGRGSMQGGNIPGGLGIDKEFLESALVPQVMLYGFLGFRTTPDGFTVDPKLPEDWPSVQITGIRLRGQVMDLTATKDRVVVRWKNRGTSAMTISTPSKRVVAEPKEGESTRIGL
jgi:hypothetical protein